MATPSSVTLCLRGLNVQYPFSQLLLAGTKTAEVRDYEFGHRKIAFPGEETTVETRGPPAQPSRNAAIDGVDVGARPAASQLVGTITFSHSEPYESRAAFRADAAAHRIQEDGPRDWDGTGERHAWRVASVRPLTVPVPVASTGQTGFGPRSFDVSFRGERRAPALEQAAGVRPGTAPPHQMVETGGGRQHPG